MSYVLCLTEVGKRRSLSANIFKNEEEISQKPKNIIHLKVVKKPSAYIALQNKHHPLKLSFSVLYHH
jgi:hypothetical protein